MKISWLVIIVLLVGAGFYVQKNHYDFMRIFGAKNRYVNACIEYGKEINPTLVDNKNKLVPSCECAYEQLRKLETDKKISALVDSGFKPKTTEEAITMLSNAQASLTCLEGALNKFSK